MKFFKISDLEKIRKQYRISYKTKANLSLNHIDKIKRHSSTRSISYQSKSKSYKDAYNYVDKLFPKYKVKDVIVYRTSLTYLASLGYKNIGGFYNRIASVIVIPDKQKTEVKKTKSPWSKIKAKITFDEVMVHELLHYVSDHQMKGISSVDREEEFAYGNSVGYLKQRGHNDDSIINDNFMPFLISVVNIKKITRIVLLKNNYDIDEFVTLPKEKTRKILSKYRDDIFEICRKQAYDRGKELIRIYSPNKEKNEDIEIIEEGVKRANLLDI